MITWLRHYRTTLSRLWDFAHSWRIESISAEFFSLHIYEVRGFTLASEDLISAKAEIAGIPYELAIGSSVNAVAQVLADIEICQDESAWAKENQCSAPFVGVRFGPTAMFSVVTGRVKYDDGCIINYDSFSKAKGELRPLERKVLPSLESALQSVFHSTKFSIQLRPITSDTFGLTPDGVLLDDVRVEILASVTLPSRFPETRFRR